MKPYIISHNTESLSFFEMKNKDISDFNNIIVGIQWHPFEYAYINKVLVCKNLPDNIEHYPQLLTFTAWYALAKNIYISDDMIGLFEYDVLFDKEILQQLNDKQWDKKTIYGIEKRDLPDGMFLDIVPAFKYLLLPEVIKKAEALPFWSITSNLIMPRQFLIDFVEWYSKFIPFIVHMPNCGHFHERAINVFAANNGYKIEIIENFAVHLNKNSHNIKLK